MHAAFNAHYTYFDPFRIRYPENIDIIMGCLSAGSEAALRHFFFTSLFVLERGMNAKARVNFSSQRGEFGQQNVVL